ncbi:MAG TPA: acyltransferase [Luteibacter sp.]|uniref:acyltransferase family protein n=1 Tax=Luteibacter sp. TaxID=1886636 RepID=UPI002C449AFD|nr:acyltransferase [Luteibacter sp.]HVI53462.1 acyltransferase [Luteibacter sp.]
MEPGRTNYRNIQGLRAVAALMVLASHLFWDIVPMRTHWAKPWFTAVGPSGVDIFFVISGFIIYQVTRRSTRHVGPGGRYRAFQEFAMKRVIRIYPLYWIVFGAATVMMIWLPPASGFMKKPQLELIFLVNSIPNYRVQAAWTLTFEVYFYAATALSMLVFPKRIHAGLFGWFATIGVVAVLTTVFGLAIPLDYVFAPILLEFLLGMGVAMLIERGEHRYRGLALCLGLVWLLIGSIPLHADGGRAALSYLLRLGCWGVPAAFVVYGAAAFELGHSRVMPAWLQALGDASFSIYLWHAVIFIGVGAAYARLGWVGVVDRSVLALVMGLVGLAVGLLSYHLVERPLLRGLGKRFLGRPVGSHSLDAVPASVR